MKSDEKKTEATKRGRKAGRRAELTELETEVMQVVWEQGVVTAADVRTALGPERPLAHTTVITVLENLRKKKVVRAVPSIGRARKFRASVEKGAVADRLVSGLLGRFFDGSPASLVAHLVKERDLDDKELEEIRSLLGEPKRGGTKK
jgi:predicted transcriptional regulator